jgi:branched-chain amino acid transport system permease protein
MVVSVVGLYVFSGTSGVLSFGHTSFMIVGGYTAALLTMPPALKGVPPLNLPGFIANAEMGSLEATLIAGVLAAAFGAVVAIPLTRLSGMAAGLATFTLLLAVHEVVSQWNSFTAGQQNLVAIPVTTTMGTVAIWAAITGAPAQANLDTRWGLRIRAAREDHVAARAVGVKISRERLIAFIISAFFVGVSGALYVQLLGAMSPETFFLSISFLLIAMLVIGGVRSLTGAVVGALAVSVISELLRLVEGGVHIGPIDWGGRLGLRELGLAILMLAILIFRPRGITGGEELTWARVRRAATFLARRSGRGDGLAVGPPGESSAS